VVWRLQGAKQDCVSSPAQRTLHALLHSAGGSLGVVARQGGGVDRAAGALQGRNNVHTSVTRSAGLGKGHASNPTNRCTKQGLPSAPRSWLLPQWLRWLRLQCRTRRIIDKRVKL